MSAVNPYASTNVPRVGVHFPLRLPVPAGFILDHLESWPTVDGQLEFYDGALWFMPPSGDDQQETVADLVTLLMNWRRAHPEFVVGTNEAGMKLSGEVRAADVAVWRREDLGPNSGGLRRVAPVLAVEVAGVEDELGALREKASWYLGRGVKVVWLVFPATRMAIVVSASGETEMTGEAPLPESSELPGLGARVSDFFLQIADH